MKRRRNSWALTSAYQVELYSIVLTEVYKPHVMEPHLHWKKWRWPLFKYAFRWGKFGSPYVALKPLH